MAKNINLRNARAAKDDEFYTQLKDVEAELAHYKRYFTDRIVYCNCDDPKYSAFWEYFHRHFTEMHLKKLIATSCQQTACAVKTEYTGGSDADIAAGVYTPLGSYGTFRSPECIAILKKADIVVTNPPFSEFSSFVSVLMNYKKQFIILGNQNAITYKNVFTYIMNNRMWLGYNCGDMSFIVPDTSEPRATRFWIDENGQKWRSLGNACWFTNIDTERRHERLSLSKRYNEAVYPKYDGYDIINIDRYADIPSDYTGIMGVPVTFLQYYCPEQFEILGIANSARWIGQHCLTQINGEKIYNRLLIRRKK